VSKVALTYRDYAALPDDGRLYEVLDGELFVTPAPGTRHQIISMQLSAQLHAHVTAHRLGLILAAPADVILADTSIVQPDAAGTYELLARPAGSAMIAAEPFSGLALADIWP